MRNPILLLAPLRVYWRRRPQPRSSATLAGAEVVPFRRPRRLLFQPPPDPTSSPSAVAGVKVGPFRRHRHHHRALHRCRGLPHRPRPEPTSSPSAVFAADGAPLEGEVTRRHPLCCFLVAATPPSPFDSRVAAPIAASREEPTSGGVVVASRHGQMWIGIDHKSLLPRWTKMQLPLSMNCWSFFMLRMASVAIPTYWLQVQPCSNATSSFKENHPNCQEAQSSFDI
uniref:Uncharacterized protein n=1 Tax=Oryza glumipatula TaxID=40148 RepID=A0A0E0B8W5_9ORYZ